MKKDFLKNNYFHITLFLITLVSFVFTLCLSGVKSLWYDDIYQLFFSWNRTFTDSMNVILSVDLNPPLWGVFAFLWLKIAPYGTLWVKLPSIIFTAASVFLVGLIGKELFGKKSGLIAAALFTLSPLITKECAYTFRSYGLYLFASTLIIFAYAKKIKRPCIKNRILFGISIFLVAFTHYFGALLCVFLGLSDFILFLKKKQKFNFCIEYLLVATAELFWLIPQLSTIGTALSSFWPSRPTVLSYFESFKYLMLDTYIGLFLILFSIACVIYCLVRCIKNRSAKELDEPYHYFKLLFAFIPIFYILLIFIYSNIKPESSVWVNRYFFSLYPMLILLSAVTVAECSEWIAQRLKKNPTLTTGIFVGILLVLLVPKYVSETVDEVYTEYEPFEQAADVVMSQPEITENNPQASVAIFNTTNCADGWYYYLSKNKNQSTEHLTMFDLASYSPRKIAKYDTIIVYAVHFDGSFSLDKIREELSQTHREVIVDENHNIYKYVRMNRSND